MVNIDPFSEQAGVCVIPVSLGFPPAFAARELLSGADFHVARGPELRPTRPRQGARRQGDAVSRARHTFVPIP